ncbi:MAG: hypothetical protein QOI29_5791 [Mycobacterium sp.]|jgi:uncharacterized protein YbjT (DUF2867 family)|nr:hypothetical protein [Mycobacterium sp.]
MTNTTNNTILVIGSTGKTGKRVADQLEKRDIDVRHGSRSVDAISKLTELAKDAGVSRLVLLSERNEAEAEKAERVLMASGPEWTIVRCAFFAQNFNEGAWLDEVLAARCRCRSTMCRSRSWTPTTSPTSRWPR